ncbi:MAG: alpha/beta fold hydrolase [Actinomycetota bacterium]|nr:alpha/beta fold hydrolase [Actinomycetota bacterium]
MDGASLVGRQALAVLRALLRPGTYAGAGRELSLALVHAALYPLGLTSVESLQEALRADRAVGAIDERLGAATAGMPVILVHGYVMNRSAFLVMSRALARAGFRHVRSFEYPQFSRGVARVAGMLRTEVEATLAASGAARCMIVGHSMGGVVARYYIQELGGQDTVDTLVTLGTPHDGTYTAAWGVGPAALDMAYRSPLLERLRAGARRADVRYISYYSDLDVWVVPAVSAKLTVPALEATNVRVRDIGHLSMLLSGEVIRSVVDYLSRPDTARPRLGHA